MNSFTTVFLSLTYLAAIVRATGEPCQISNSKLDPNSHKFRSDCGPQDYCAVSLANTGSISAAIKGPPTKRDEITKTTLPEGSHQHRSGIHNPHHFHHSGSSAYKHEAQLSRRGLLQNVFLAAVADVSLNDTMESQAEDSDTPMINEKDDGTPPPFGVNATGTCQPKGCRKDEFPFG